MRNIHVELSIQIILDRIHKAGNSARHRLTYKDLGETVLCNGYEIAYLRGLRDQLVVTTHRTGTSFVFQIGTEAQTEDSINRAVKLILDEVRRAPLANIEFH